MKKYRLSPLADFDLDEIWEFIARNDREMAANFISELMREFTLLARQPQLGRGREDLSANLRLFPYRRYLIFYIPIDGGIEIVRVLHGARDVETEFEM